MHGASRYSTRMDLSQMGSELACLIAHLQRKLHVNLKKTTVTHAIHAIAPARGRPSVHHCDGAAITRKRSIPVPPRSTSFAARRTTFRYAQHSAAPDPALQPDHSFTRKRATLRAGRYTPHALERRRGVVRPSAEDQRISVATLPAARRPGYRSDCHETASTASVSETRFRALDATIRAVSKVHRIYVPYHETLRPRIPFHFSNNALCFFPKKHVMIAA
jgi:hypothetical protein